MSERTCADETLQNEAAAWHEHYKQAEKTIADLIARNDALQARVDALDMREIVGELRRIYELLEHGEPMAARMRLGHLLKRIDRESQG